MPASPRTRIRRGLPPSALPLSPILSAGDAGISSIRDRGPLNAPPPPSPKATRSHDPAQLLLATVIGTRGGSHPPSVVRASPSSPGPSDFLFFFDLSSSRRVSVGLFFFFFSALPTPAGYGIQPNYRPAVQLRLVLYSRVLASRLEICMHKMVAY